MTLEPLQQRIRDAAASGKALRLRGGGSKDFYGNVPRGEILDTRGYAGVVSYEPTELVITARCGTPLSEVEQVLEKSGQCLPFEPPHFGAATFGGCIAAGLSGPRRAAAGALRDYVLGVLLVDGRARVLSFGGRVMKNVAGYDVSRLLAGSLGALGLIAEASLKVLPRPRYEATLRLEMSEAQALESVAGWAGRPLPVSATAWHANELRVRLSGAEPAVQAAAGKLGGERLAQAQADAFWAGVREQADAFFAGPEPLWRVALPGGAARFEAPGRQMIEWGGALRWLKTDAASQAVRDAAARLGGHATLFRAAHKAVPVFTPLDAARMRLHRELKAAFDPAGIFNPGRLYPEL